MASVFVKVKVSERLPKESGGVIGYCSTADILQQFYFDRDKGIFHDPLYDEENPMKVTIWLEEIELPSEEEITIEADKIDNWKESYEFERDANFVLNKLKGE